MATTSQLASERNDISLHVLWETIDGMPETVIAWPSYDEESRYDFALEWWNSLDMFQHLIESAESGELSDSQRRRFEQLVQRYEEVMPLIEQLELELIPIPKISVRRRA